MPSRGRSPRRRRHRCRRGAAPRRRSRAARPADTLHLHLRPGATDGKQSAHTPATRRASPAPPSPTAATTRPPRRLRWDQRAIRRPPRPGPRSPRHDAARLRNRPVPRCPHHPPPLRRMLHRRRPPDRPESPPDRYEATRAHRDEAPRRSAARGSIGFHLFQHGVWLRRDTAPEEPGEHTERTTRGKSVSLHGVSVEGRTVRPAPSGRSGPDGTRARPARASPRQHH